MNTLFTLSALLLVRLATSSPIKNGLETSSEVSDDGTLSINDLFFREKYVVYTGENDVTKIVVPLNEINIDDNTDIDDFDFYVFFIEAGKGLYVFKDGAATKVLDNGKDISSSLRDGSKKVFFGATDGIYTFNAEKKTAEKYGTLTDNVRNIAVINGTNNLYILTEDNVVYKVTDDGTKKEKVSGVKDAQQIMLDSSMNLYFVNSKKRVFIKSFEDGTVVKVKGLPKNPETVGFLRPPFVIENIVPFVADDRVYRILSDGKSQFSGLIFSIKPTAYAAEGTAVIYMAHDKKIYKYLIDDLQALEEEDDNALAAAPSLVNDKVSNIKQAANKKAFRQ